MHIITTSFKLSSQEEKNVLAHSLIANAKSQIENVIQLLSSGGISSQTYGFGKQLARGLTNLVGLYLIVNTRTNKLYVGGTSDLAQRKGEYNQSFTNPTRTNKLSKGLQHDLKQGNITDFCFIPIVGIPQDKLSGFQNDSSKRKQISSFIDLEVEQTLLNFYLDPVNQRSVSFYNEKTIGSFGKGNTYGGSPESGTKDRPLKYKDLYAWESVSAAANSLGKDRKTIRNRKAKGTLVEISPEDYNNFQGTKISNENSKTYFKDKPDALAQLKKQLEFSG